MKIENETVKVKAESYVERWQKEQMKKLMKEKAGEELEQNDRSEGSETKKEKRRRK